jgi:type II secretory ATPase GspE/PulE/Tfp pilus assembly ATPase PilB-like protein
VALERPEDEVGRRLLGRGRGCDVCTHTGYDGSGPLVGLLPADEALRRRVADGTPLSGAPAPLVESDPVRDELVRMCLDGVTTFADVRRVLGPAAP